MKHIAVIGAGIAGITTAYYLARDGHQVTVIDQEPYPAMRTSYANGGQVSVSNSEVWTTWSNVIKGAKWVLKKDAPLLIRPSLDLDKAAWLAKFLYHTANNDYARNTAATIRMGIESRRLYQEMLAEHAIEFDQTPAGIMHFYKDPMYWHHAQSVQELYEGNGCEWTLLTADQVHDRDPSLANVRGILGGAWTPQDWTGDIHKFCYEMSRVLADTYSVQFLYNFLVEDLKTFVEYGFADHLVITSGVGSVKLAKTVGDRLPIYPVKGYSITVNLDSDSLNHVPQVSLLDDQAKIVTSTLGNRFRVAGTAELAGENYDIRRDRIDPLLRWVQTNFPKINTHDYSQWACLRPMTPNMMPIAKPSDKHPAVYYNTGHGHLGWTLAPATAKKTADFFKSNNR